MESLSFRLLIAIILLSCQVSCTDNPDDGVLTLKVAHNGSEQHPFQTGYQEFARVLGDETNGLVNIEIFPSSQLGSEEEAIEMVRLGVISSTATATASLGPFVPEVDVLNFPFIFRDIEHFYHVLDGPVGERINKKLEDDLDIIVLGWWYSGVRNVWNSERPVHVPEDLKGLKIRVIGSAVVVDAFNALGAQATTMSFGELYSAVQQGVLDGGETDSTDLLIEKFFEVTEFVSLTRHIYLAAPLTFSKKKFEKLPQHMQVAIRKAGEASVLVQRQAMETNNQDSLEALKKIGLIFNQVNNDAFTKSIADGQVYLRNAKHVGGIELIEEVIRQ
ncbi:MAG: TRAP transporter substrate-binding protein [Gammaproteobacteria bacterium]|nr:TRAP transporter substrate-binding protein [Gammaproteobacteria bacterium]